MLKEAIAMLSQNKEAWAALQTGQLQMAGLGALEQKALRDVFNVNKEDRLLKSDGLAYWRID
ncbi:hypothetical protein B9G55_11420 [Saccharibacillus sp. O16]|nr:hypothetical protein B9G55_11420 [Saccharibacillus sp. O16]